MIREESAVRSGPTPAWRRLEIDNNIAENAMRGISGMRSPRSPMLIRSAGSMNCCPGRSRLDMATQITIEPTAAA